MEANLPSVVAPDQPKPAPTAAPAPAEPALYKKAGGDWNKADQSYFNAVNKLTEVQGALATESARRTQLENALMALSGNGQPVNADPLEQLQSELGLPIEPFRKAVASEIERSLAGLFGPLVQQMEADESLAGEIDNFEQLRGEARKFMRDNPEVAETFNAVRASGKHAQAWKYAIKEALIAKNAPQTPRSPHAGLPGGVTPQGRSPVNPTGPEQATRETEALKYGHEYGDMSGYRHERFKGTSIAKAVIDGLRQAGYTLPEGGGAY